MHVVKVLSLIATPVTNACFLCVGTPLKIFSGINENLGLGLLPLVGWAHTLHQRKEEVMKLR